MTGPIVTPSMVAFAVVVILLSLLAYACAVRSGGWMGPVRGSRRG